MIKVGIEVEGPYTGSKTVFCDVDCLNSLFLESYLSGANINGDMCLYINDLNNQLTPETLRNFLNNGKGKTFKHITVERTMPFKVCKEFSNITCMLRISVTDEFFNKLLALMKTSPDNVVVKFDNGNRSVLCIHKGDISTTFPEDYAGDIVLGE